MELRHRGIRAGAKAHRTGPPRRHGTPDIVAAEMVAKGPCIEISAKTNARFIFRSSVPHGIYIRQYFISCPRYNRKIAGDIAKPEDTVMKYAKSMRTDVSLTSDLKRSAIPESDERFTPGDFFRQAGAVIAVCLSLGFLVHLLLA
jgi:hypothetical protein